MSISVSTADVTVRAAEDDVTLPEDAVMFAAPALTPVARPDASMVATPVALEFHITLFVISVVLPSEKMPLAVNDCDWPVAMEAVAGVMTIDASCAAVTVAVAEPWVDPIVAVMVELPAETPVTNPEELTVAYAVLSAFQVTRLVTSFELPSPYTPTAESCLFCPEAIENTAGVIVIDIGEGAVTTTFAVPETEPIEAVIATVPALSDVNIPELLIVAIVVSRLFHATWPVIDCVLLSV
jgi:hypothetical protein